MELEQRIKALLSKIVDKKSPYYEQLATINNFKIYQLCYLPLAEEQCMSGNFYSPFGESAGDKCIHARIFLYTELGELESTIEWRYSWREE